MSSNELHESKLHEISHFTINKNTMLVIDCNNCKDKKRIFNASQKCMACFTKGFFTLKNRKIKGCLFISYEREIEFKHIELFTDYFNKIRKIKKFINKVELIRKEDCTYEEFGCKALKKENCLENLNYYDPILLYIMLVKERALVDASIVNDSKCIQCLSRVKNNLEKSIEFLNRFKIINKFKKFKAENNLPEIYSKFYEFLFTNSFLMHDKENIDVTTVEFNEEEKVIDVYTIGKEEIFQITIFQIQDEFEKRYVISLYDELKSEKSLFDRIIQDCIKNMTAITFNRVIPLERLISIYEKDVLAFLNIKFKKLSNIEKKKIAFFVALKRVNIDKLFPLLIDDNVEEIFLDSINEKIYINHQKYGRCKTDLILYSNEIERLKTFLRIYSGQRLDYTNPSVKYVIKNKYFYCRFAIDIEPIHINKFGLDIRKLNKNILTVQDLLKNKTLNPLMAAFLYFSLIHRCNITATGETDTGKTTLINALDLLTPKEFRKIYIENVVESLNQIEFDKHQLKYVVDSLDPSQERINRIKEYSKANQIKTLLHRSPDIIYLGEILTKEEARALFHCLAAGLRGFQTIHSKTVSSLLNRVVHFFNIDPSCLNDLDIIIFMKKSHFKRRMISISEICNENIDLSNKDEIIFNYDPETKEWILLKPLYETKVIQKIKNSEDLNEVKFNSYMDIYTNIFQYLSTVPRINNRELITLFHKLSYFSFRSIDKLRFFWEKWKNN